MVFNSFFCCHLCHSRGGLRSLHSATPHLTGAGIHYSPCWSELRHYAPTRVASQLPTFLTTPLHCISFHLHLRWFRQPSCTPDPTRTWAVIVAVLVRSMEPISRETNNLSNRLVIIPSLKTSELLPSCSPTSLVILSNLSQLDFNLSSSSRNKVS